MSWISKDLKLDIDKQTGMPTNEESAWNPTDEERKITEMVRTHFALGYNNLMRPRVEFNDLSLLTRDQTDFLAWNTYQPNNGEAFPGDQINSWRSNAIRPIERNKAISIAAHATSRMLFPKLMAFTEGSQHQEDAARVMRDLMEWVCDTYNYPFIVLQAIIQALVAPISILYQEYVETFREVKRELQEDGTYRMEKILDESLSGFRAFVVPVDQFYFENFYEQDVQKQAWVIWRRVQSNQTLAAKYGHLPNFKYVRPGMITLFNNPNQGVYNVYDTSMSQYEGEEVIYWNKSMDVRLVFVNGILMTKYNESNPRYDKLYPFATTFYEFFHSRCIAGKSLVFKLAHDAQVLNTLYQMVIDGKYLDLMPAFFASGGEMIDSAVMVPGKITTFQDPNSNLTPIRPQASDTRGGLEVLQAVEQSINQSSEQPIAQEGGSETAYEVSKKEQERNAQLGLFIQMIGKLVLEYGALMLGDIKQHLTVADVQQIEDNPELVYKVFLMEKKDQKNKHKVKKIMFDTEMSDDSLKESMKTRKMQNDEDVEIARVNPILFRNLKFMMTMTTDVLNQRSDDVERMYRLEVYDRAINNPVANQEEVTKDFLFGAYAMSARDPEKYLAKQPTGGAQMPGIPQQQPQPSVSPQSVTTQGVQSVLT